MSFDFKIVTLSEELNFLEGYTTQSGDLKFGFSRAYLSKLQQSLRYQNSFQVLSFDHESGNFAGYISSYSDLKPFMDFQSIGELVVDEKYRCLAVATVLLGLVKNFAISKNLSSLVTQTEHNNTPAHKLYQKYGFRPIEYSNPTNHITFRLSLV
jgi:ribosomal protein S18 acetylase RimI-like enzyme